MNDLKNRTKQFALDVMEFCSGLPSKPEYNIIRYQLIRCATSVGANYRSACRAKSKLDFIAKMAIVEEEADEALYWMELLEALGLNAADVLRRLKDEASQLTAIVVASKKTARAGLGR